MKAVVKANKTNMLHLLSNLGVEIKKYWRCVLLIVSVLILLCAVIFARIQYRASLHTHFSFIGNMSDATIIADVGRGTINTARIYLIAEENNVFSIDNAHIFFDGEAFANISMLTWYINDGAVDGRMIIKRSNALTYPDMLTFNGFNIGTNGRCFILGSGSTLSGWHRGGHDVFLDESVIIASDSSGQELFRSDTRFSFIPGQDPVQIRFNEEVTLRTPNYFGPIGHDIVYARVNAQLEGINSAVFSGRGSVAYLDYERNLTGHRVNLQDARLIADIRLFEDPHDVSVRIDMNGSVSVATISGRDIFPNFTEWFSGASFWTLAVGFISSLAAVLNVVVHSLKIKSQKKQSSKNNEGDMSVNGIINSPIVNNNANTFTESKTCQALSDVMGYDLTCEQNRENSIILNDLLRKLINLPAETRSLLAIMVSQSFEDKRFNSCSVPIHEVMSFTGKDQTYLFQHIDILNRRELISEPEMNDNGCLFCELFGDAETGWNYWNDIREYCSKAKIPTARIIADMDFSLFD